MTDGFSFALWPSHPIACLPVSEPSLSPAVPVPALPVGHAKRHPRRARATAWLLFATGLWGLSFPLAKTLSLAQLRLLPGADTWFLAAVGLVFRFGGAAAILAFAALPTLRGLTRGECRQGIGLGIFACGGMLFQLDGLNYTAASTSAFLTSCYCVTIPVIVALQRRRWPPAVVIVSCALATLGIGALAGLDWRTLHLGRGEGETILSSFFFAAQIFWLERPAFARNRTTHATVVMFTVLTGTALPVLAWRAGSWDAVRTAAFGSGAIIACLVALTLLCTLCTFTLMNHWQPEIEATEAGLIYCAEPVWTGVFALFLPAWLAVWTGADYANETLTLRLLLGGGLITVANVCVQLRKPPAAG